MFEKYSPAGKPRFLDKIEANTTKTKKARFTAIVVFGYAKYPEFY